VASAVSTRFIGVISEIERVSWAARSLVRWRRGNVLGCSIVLGLSGRHPIEKFGERWCGGRESSVGPHVEGAVGFSDPGLAEHALGFFRGFF
jgi:hypothetical protein